MGLSGQDEPYLGRQSEIAGRRSFDAVNDHRNPKTIHAPIGAYSHQVEVAAGAKWLAVAGQVGRTRDGNVPEDPIEQVKLALENVRLNLGAAGMSVADVVKLNWYVVGQMDMARRREVALAWLGGHEPASTFVYVAALAAPEYRVEIEAWAAK
jgi:enamine deaminase RidA (YjgF/YER057c/UK114 family)